MAKRSLNAKVDLQFYDYCPISAPMHLVFPDACWDGDMPFPGKSRHHWSKSWPWLGISLIRHRIVSKPLPLDSPRRRRSIRVNDAPFSSYGYLKIDPQIRAQREILPEPTGGTRERERGQSSRPRRPRPEPCFGPSLQRGTIFNQRRGGKAYYSASATEKCYSFVVSGSILALFSTFYSSKNCLHRRLIAVALCRRIISRNIYRKIREFVKSYMWNKN